MYSTLYKTDIFVKDWCKLVRMGDMYRMTYTPTKRRAGFEDVNVMHYEHEDDFGNKSTRYFMRDISKDKIERKKDVSSDVEKLNRNIMRARNKVIEYVMCNDFAYFVTLTLDASKIERNDINVFSKKFSAFIRNFNQRVAFDNPVKYLLIPERHKSGDWHLHGFFSDIPMDKLQKFDIHSDEKLPRYIVDKIKAGDVLYRFPDYEKRFGYNIFEPIHNKKASVLYMTKYLMKNKDCNVTDIGKHLYYCSRRLNTATVVKEGMLLDSSFEFDFSNDFCSISTFDSLSECDLQMLCDKIADYDAWSLDDLRQGQKNYDGWYVPYDMNTGEFIGKDIGGEIFDNQCFN